MAREIQAAAYDGDEQRLQRTAELFLDAFRTHVCDEAGAMASLSPTEVRLLRRGQARLLALATGVLRDAAGGCSGPPRRCANRAEELLAFLTLQARDERCALHDPAA